MSNITNMLSSSDSERTPPSGSDQDVSSAEHDIGGQSGNAHEVRVSVWPAQGTSIDFQLLQDHGSRDQDNRVGEKHTGFRFMDLPSEIRNVIYMKTLATQDETFYIGSYHCRRLNRSRPVLGTGLSPFARLSNNMNQFAASPRNLALLRASKAVYAEAGQILYGQRLAFTDMSALQAFLLGLKPAQLGLLRHVGISDLRYEAHLMPSVFALLAGADSLETLIPGIENTWSAPVSLNISPHRIDDTVSILEWDAVVGRQLAGEVYCRIFPYLRQAVPARGINKVMEVLSVFEEVFRKGSDRFVISFQLQHPVGSEWTEERKAAMKKAMGEEIERLVKADNK